MSDIERDELAQLVGSERLLLLDVRGSYEYTGAMGAPCDPRQGHILGARNLDVGLLVQMTVAEIEVELGPPGDHEIVCYCHSGSRSAHAVAILALAGYAARNYRGSWHEWSRDASLPIVVETPPSS